MCLARITLSPYRDFGLSTNDVQATKGFKDRFKAGKKPVSTYNNEEKAGYSHLWSCLITIIVFK